jgi:hypothetical protein
MADFCKMSESERLKSLLKIMVAYHKTKAICDVWHQMLQNLKEMANEKSDEMDIVPNFNESLQNEIHIFQAELVDVQVSHIKTADIFYECLNVHSVLPKDDFNKAVEANKEDANTVQKDLYENKPLCELLILLADTIKGNSMIDKQTSEKKNS